MELGSFAASIELIDIHSLQNRQLFIDYANYLRTAKVKGRSTTMKSGTDSSAIFKQFNGAC